MSNASLIPVVEAVVDEKVGNGDMFTAHDVTLEVRNRGHRAGHNEVRDAVHDYYSRGGLGVAYTRTNISVPGGQPFLYHRGADDPSTYGNIRGGGGALASPSPATIPVPPVGKSGDDDDDDDDDEDDDDGQPVSIPPSLLGSLGTNSSVVGGGQVGGIAVGTPSNNGHAHNTRTSNKPGNTKARTVDGRGTLSIPAPIIRKLFKVGQKVYAVAGTQGVVLSATQPPAAAVFGKYTVDTHEQVRVTQALLQRAGIAGKQYDVEEGPDYVAVKLAK